MPKPTAYLGPALTFCEQAALCYTGDNSDHLLPCPGVEAVFAAVDEGKALQGIVPMENSCEGSVNQTLDLLAYDYKLKISGEIIIPVKHHVLARKGFKPGQISCILSHPQALAQCRKNLRYRFPDAQLRVVSSTAEAARLVAATAKPWAALASLGAAQAYGLSVMIANVHDYPDNETRFVVISREEKPYSENWKMSLLIHTRHVPGALYECLHEFAARGINLSKIESRPERRRVGEYMFFIDIDGPGEAADIKNALTALRKIAEEVRILGTYPAAVRV